MACQSLTRVLFPPGGGGPKFLSRRSGEPLSVGEVERLVEDGWTHGGLPCGKCMPCRVARQGDVAARGSHELLLHGASSSVTLTYSDAFVPPGGGLRRRDLTLFNKRVRERAAREGWPPVRIFGCGEYGERTMRAHYHLALFGFWPPDAVQTGKRGERPVFRSELLEQLWPYGRHELELATPEAIDYICGYFGKTLDGALADRVYSYRAPDTGERIALPPPFMVFPSRPGLGRGFVERFQGDVYPSDEVIRKGKRVGKAPRYYDRVVGEVQPDLIAGVKAKRMERALRPVVAANSTWERRQVRAEVLAARLKVRQRAL